MKDINPNVHPKSGYKFQEADQSWHVADTWGGVVARVTAYRRRRGAEIGDVWREVVEQACRREPVLCTEVNSATQTKLREASLKTRTLNYLNSLRGKQQSFVEDRLARDRAAVCAGCPLNTPLNEGCSSCRESLKALRQEIIGNRHRDGRLNSCAILGEDIQTALSLDSQTVINGELPGHCWRKRS